MAEELSEGPELLEHLKSLNLSKEEVSRFTTIFKEPEFKEMFMNYMNEISDNGNKESIEAHIKQCERNAKHHGKSPMEGKDLLLPYADFCVKTYDTKTQKKVFINICYCNKIKNCMSTEVPSRGGTQWEIPYSLGGPSGEKDKAGMKCFVYDFIVGDKTHKHTNDSKPFKKFLIATAIEAIEKQKSTQLDRNYSLPLLKYKGKNGSKDPRIFTIKKENSSKTSKENNDLKKLEYASKSNEDKTKNKNICKKEDDTKKTIENACEKEDGIKKEEGPKKEIGQQIHHSNDSCTSNVENDQHKDVINLEEWEKEIKPDYEVLYSSTIDYGRYWTDSQIKDNNAIPEAIVLRITLPNIVQLNDVFVDLQDTNQVLLRVPGKYRLMVDLKYNVNKLCCKAQWKNETYQLILTLPVAIANSKI